jgi:hypothetical protein
MIVVEAADFFLVDRIDASMPRTFGDIVQERVQRGLWALGFYFYCPIGEIPCEASDTVLERTLLSEEAEAHSLYEPANDKMNTHHALLWYGSEWECIRDCCERHECAMSCYA